GVQTTMYALAAHIYPTDIRSTGVGTAVAVGRIGNVVAAYVGSTAIDRGGSSGYFALMAGLMLLGFASLAAIKRHVPRAGYAPLLQPGRQARRHQQRDELTPAALRRVVAAHFLLH